MVSKQATCHINLISLCSYHVTDMIKNLELHLLVVLILLKIKFEYAQINVDKPAILMSKTVCINPCKLIS